MKKQLNYDYSSGREACRQYGLKFSEEHAACADEVFTRAQYTQEQVDEAVNLHVYLVAHMFTPKNYKWKDRVVMAFWFLFHFLCRSKLPKKGQ